MKRILIATVSFLALTGATYAAGVAVGAATSSSGVITVGRAARLRPSNVSTGLGVGGSVRGTAVGLGVSSSNSRWRIGWPRRWRRDRHRLRSRGWFYASLIQLTPAPKKGGGLLLFAVTGGARDETLSDFDRSLDDQRSDRSRFRWVRCLMSGLSPPRPARASAPTPRAVQRRHQHAALRHLDLCRPRQPLPANASGTSVAGTSGNGLVASFPAAALTAASGASGTGAAAAAVGDGQPISIPPPRSREHLKNLEGAR